MDVRTRQAAGEAVLGALASASLRAVPLVVPDGPAGSPVCDDRTFAQVLPQARRALGTGQALIVTVGSGVVTDLGKWAAKDMGVSFVAVATALSMNGYASANVAPTINGLKTLLEARAPVGVVAPMDVLARAPHEMTAAGLGDVLAKSVSSADWLLNHLLFGDYYCARSVGLIEGIEPLYYRNPQGLPNRDETVLAGLLEALLLTGAAMTMAGSSAPASGGEHMLSHALDMMSALDGKPHDLHGRQVGVGTILASELYRRVLGINSPQWRLPPQPDMSFWGSLAPEMERQWSRKAPRYAAAKQALSRGGAWDDLRRALAPIVRPPEVLRDCLKAARAAWRPADLGMDASRVRTAWAHGAEIRSRFTVLDLAALAGLSPLDAAEGWT
jgi:glycerol-1-phosphate dehydrogenase [NAD(P)+]